MADFVICARHSTAMYTQFPIHVANANEVATGDYTLDLSLDT
jgi:hypothetical protein